MGKIVLGIIVFLLVSTALYFSFSSSIPSLRTPMPTQDPSTVKPSTAPTTLIHSNETGLNIPQGYTLSVFATKLGAARDLQFSPGGTLLVSSMDRGIIYAISKPNTSKPLVSDLSRPHGIAFYEGKLYVAQEKMISRYDWNEPRLTASNKKDILPLPAGGRHFTRSIVFTANSTMLVSLGSSCDVCDEKDEWIATIIEANPDGTNAHVYAKGLRNAVFLTTNPQTNEVWATEMGRDYLGDTTPPDELNLITQNGNYGWPYCYGNKIHDTQFDKKTYIRDPCADSIAPVYEVPAHSAPLGVTFIPTTSPLISTGNLLVAYHGSWNKSEPSGYKVVSLTVEGKHVTQEKDIITGYRTSSGQVIARPVDVAFDSIGNLYISDDKSGNIYLLSLQ